MTALKIGVLTGVFTLEPRVGFLLGIACLVVGVGGAIVWEVWDRHVDRRRARARAYRKMTLAQPHPDDWRLLIPRRWRIERNLRFGLWMLGRGFRN